MQLPQTYMRVILLRAGPMYLYQFRLVHQTAPRPPDSVQLHAFNLAFSRPLLPIAIWVQLYQASYARPG